MNPDPSMVDCPCWEVSPIEDQDLLLEMLPDLVPDDAIFEIEPINLEDRKTFEADFERMKYEV